MLLKRLSSWYVLYIWTEYNFDFFASEVSSLSIKICVIGTNEMFILNIWSNLTSVYHNVFGLAITTVIISENTTKYYKKIKDITLNISLLFTFCLF